METELTNKLTTLPKFPYNLVIERILTMEDFDSQSYVPNHIITMQIHNAKTTISQYTTKAEI